MDDYRGKYFLVNGQIKECLVQDFTQGTLHFALDKGYESLDEGGCVVPSFKVHVREVALLTEKEAYEYKLSLCTPE